MSETRDETYETLLKSKSISSYPLFVNHLLPNISIVCIRFAGSFSSICDISFLISQFFIFSRRGGRHVMDACISAILLPLNGYSLVRSKNKLIPAAQISTLFPSISLSYAELKHSGAIKRTVPLVPFMTSRVDSKN